MSQLSQEYILDFERPLKKLEEQVKELRDSELRPDMDISQEIKSLEKKISELTKEIYNNLSPWERVQVARHPQRPHSSDFIRDIFTDFHEIHGDRKYADDASMITGFAQLEGSPVALIGIEKGRKTKEKVQRNFGMPRPEGYRKAARLMELAGKFHLPVITFIDTPGAYPGIGAEERGQSEAIAYNLEKMFSIPTPMVSIVIGEGGSGGALGIGVTDKILMMEYSVYSVISPESCASILWSDPKKAQQAANSLNLVPQKALEFKIIDGVISEPPGGAHRDPQKASQELKKYLLSELKSLSTIETNDLLERRFKKFRQIGLTAFKETVQKKKK